MNEANKTTTAATPNATKVTPAQVKPDMLVMCSKNANLGVVDHMQGPANIKLRKDSAGVHHYIPLSWVTRTDAGLHLDRPGEQAMREWSIDAPKA